MNKYILGFLLLISYSNSMASTDCTFYAEPLSKSAGLFKIEDGEDPIFSKGFKEYLEYLKDVKYLKRAPFISDEIIGFLKKKGYSISNDKEEASLLLNIYSECKQLVKYPNYKYSCHEIESKAVITNLKSLKSVTAYGRSKALFLSTFFKASYLKAEKRAVINLNLKDCESD